jgi:hypothetical protein
MGASLALAGGETWIRMRGIADTAVRSLDPGPAVLILAGREIALQPGTRTGIAGPGNCLAMFT